MYQLRKSFTISIETEKKAAVFFIPLFISRRFLLALVILYCGNYPVLQIVFYMLVGYLTMAFYVMVKPFERVSLYRFQVTNELFALLIGYTAVCHMIIWSDSAPTRTLLGYVAEVLF